MLGTIVAALIDLGKVSGGTGGALRFLNEIYARVKAANPHLASVVEPLVTAIMEETKNPDGSFSISEDTVRAGLDDFLGVLQGGVVGPPDSGAGSVL